MAKDRFRTTYSKSKKFQQGVDKTFNRINTKAQPIRKYDERWAFGKYKGQHVMEAPVPYLKWVLNNWQGLTEDQARIIKRYV
jgi:hypothetical protein